MDEETKKILQLASSYPLLGIDAVRARQIVDECIGLQRACDAATQQFGVSDEARFAALFTAPSSATGPQ